MCRARPRSARAPSRACASSCFRLEQRLRGRASDSPKVIEQRLRVAREELARQDEFDLRVVNDDPQRAADEIAAAAAIDVP